MMSNNLSYILAQWASNNEARKAQLEEWQEQAILSIASGGGKDVVSTSANGTSVTFASGKTNEDWLMAVTNALNILNGNAPPKVKRPIFMSPPF